MISSVGPCQIITLLVVVQRLVELWVARRNTVRLLAAGGVEWGAAHYPLFIVLHATWLLALFFSVPADATVNWWLIGLYGMLQLARLWVIVSLAGRWTTRIIVLPGAPLVARGPYRFMRHPNYALVALEIPLLPVAFGAWQLALTFGVANLFLLLYRIRVEEQAIGLRPSSNI